MAFKIVMKRRDLLKAGLLTAFAAPLYSTGLTKAVSKPKKVKKKVMNIIFLVSDGMSMGTFTMADLLSVRKYGKHSNWLQLYIDGEASRSIMETSSANSLVTDSAAGSSAWGSGMKVNNGALNVGPNGEKPVPILQKFKSVGKSVGCVTTVPITHATPAGFCVNIGSRGDQAEIAELYLDLKFDVMMGGGSEFFDKSKRKDGRDLFGDFTSKGFEVVQHRDKMMNLKKGKPVLGVFYENGLPFTVDRNSVPDLQKKVPTLAEMLSKSIELMEGNPNGFVIQVEGGKVDWAAHSNDAPGLVYDQLAFDDAVGVAVEFAKKRDDTLVIITTDHGNANPGLFYGRKANDNFDKMLTIKHSNEYVFSQIPDNASATQVQTIISDLQGITLEEKQCELIAERFKTLKEGERANPRRLPFVELAEFQREHFSIKFAATEHSGDFVELGMFGPGSELLTDFTVNTDLHQLMLDVTETVYK